MNWVDYEVEVYSSYTKEYNSGGRVCICLGCKPIKTPEKDYEEKNTELRKSLDANNIYYHQLYTERYSGWYTLRHPFEKWEEMTDAELTYLKLIGKVKRG